MHPLRRMVLRLFPRKAGLESSPRHWEHLTENQKKELSERSLAAGEIALYNDDLNGLAHFEAAATLAGDNPEVWYREGVAFYEYGLAEGREKALLLASRYFKLAAQLAPDIPEIWSGWGATLLQLGAAYSEHHFYLEAKEKLQKAIETGKRLPKEALAVLYWNFGLVWTELAQHSGEAIDVQLAIQAFRNSMECQERPSPEFLNDTGNAYLQMGLLVNDPRLFLQAADLVQEAVDLAPLYLEGWASLAYVYAQLYLNTMDEKYSARSCHCYERLCQEDPSEPDHWLGWSQILGESGRLNRDAKKLRLSIEKAIRGHNIDKDNAPLLYQWVEALSHLGSLTGRLDLLIEAENMILRGHDQFGDEPDLWHAYGICLLAFGQYYSDPDYYEYAIEKLQYGLSLDRTNAEIWQALALAHTHLAHLTGHLDLIERATRFYTRALDLKPSCPALLFDAANAWLLACDLRDDPKDLDQAVQLYETLLQTQKEALLNHPEWLFQYTTAIEWLGEYNGDESYISKAADLYLHVLLIDPETPKIHFRIAMCFVKLAEHSLEAEYYKRALHYFGFAIRQDEEDDTAWLECGLASIHLAHHSLEEDAINQHYADAEQKLIRAGQLGNLSALYNLASLYSILGRTEEAMEFICKAEKAFVLPTIEEMFEDEWLDNLRGTEAFAEFLSNLETRHGNSSPDL